MAAQSDLWVGSLELGHRAATIRRHRKLFTAVVVSASTVTCALLAVLAGRHALSRQVHTLNWAFLPAVLGAHVIAYGGYLVVHHQVVNRPGLTPISWRRGVHIALVGFGAWLLSGGFNVDRHALQFAGSEASEASITVITLGALEIAVLTPAAFVCAVLLIGAHHLSASVTLPWVIGVPLGLLLVLLTLWWGTRHRGQPVVGRLRSAMSTLSLGIVAMFVLLRQPRRGPAAATGIVLYWTADIVAFWAALRFVGAGTSLSRLVVAYAAGYLFTRRTLPFAGTILVELLLTLSLAWVGVPLAAAAMAVLVYRLSDFVLTLGAALFASSLLERTVSIVERARPALAPDELTLAGEEVS